MPNPTGSGLSGDADLSTPGWESRVKERAAAEAQRRRSRKTGRRKRAASFAVDIDPEFIILAGHAARKRGMPKTAYYRRAIAAFIAYDLDVPFEDVVAFCPAVAPHGHPLRKESGLRGGGRSKDDGEGFGSWKVV